MRWLHHLECGHTEERRRKAPAQEIGCVKCEATGATLRRPTPLIEMDLSSFLDDEDPSARLALIEGLEGRIQAGLARALKVDHDQVRITMSGMKVASAMVLLDGEDALRLAEVNT